MTPAAILLILVALQTKHLIADYVLQTPYMVRNKGRYGHPGGLLHAATHTALTCVVLATAQAPLAMLLVLCGLEFVLHYHIDWAKEQVSRRVRATPDMARFWQLHGLDQYLHHLTYVGIVWWTVRSLSAGGPG